MKKALCAILSLVTAFGASMAIGCGGPGGNGGSEEGTLKVEFLKAGYGTEVYTELAKEFMSQNSDIKVKLVPNESINSTTENRLRTGTGLSDVYQVSYWGNVRKWAVRGYVLDITDLYGQEVENGQTLRDRIAVSGQDAFSVYNKYYAIPHEASISGLLYNVKMFQDNGWEVPTTTQELADLCEEILSAKLKVTVDNKSYDVKPIVYCGSTSDGYWPSMLNTWWLQYSGVEKLKEFSEYASPEVYKDEGRLRALECLAQFADNDKYYPSNVMSKDHITAQLDFIQGKAAMVPCGSWFSTEMQLYLESFPDFEYAMMSTPVVSDENGESQAHDPDVKYLYEGSEQCWFIAKKSSNVAAAKKWLQFISSEKACQIWTRYTGGMYAYNYDSQSLYEGASTFTKSLIDIWNSSTPYKYYSNHYLAIESKVGTWPQQHSPYIAFRSYNTSPEAYYNADYDYISDNWSAWTKS